MHVDSSLIMIVTVKRGSKERVIIIILINIKISVDKQTYHCDHKCLCLLMKWHLSDVYLCSWDVASFLRGLRVG